MIQSRAGEFGQPATTADMPGQEPKDRLRQHTDDAKRQAEDLRRQAGEAAHDAGERLKQMGRETKDRAAQAARQTTSQVRDRATEAVAQQKNRLAEEVSVFGLALHRAAETLESNDDKVAGQYAHKAADWIDGIANFLREKDVTAMTRTCGDFTRRHPEVVLGGLFLAGVSVARFLKASDRPREDDFETDRSYMSDPDYSPVMDTGLGGDAYLESYDETGYGDIGLYAGEAEATPTYGSSDPLGSSVAEPSVPSDTEDIPNVTSAQPSDDDLGMSGGQCSIDNPNKPR